MHVWLAEELSNRDPDLVGFWPMFGSLLDCSGYAQHGRIYDNTDDVGVEVKGENKCCLISGRPSLSIPSATSWYAQADSSSSNCSFSVTQPFSISFWFYNTSTTSSNFYTVDKIKVNSTIGPSLGIETGYRTFIAGNGEILFFEIKAESENKIEVYSSIPSGSAKNDKWIHCVVTYDGKYSASGVRMFYDGQPVSFVINSNSLVLSDVITNTNNIRFGGSRQLGTVMAMPAETAIFSKGCVGQVRIYKRELNKQDVIRIYNSEKILASQKTIKNGSTPITNSIDFYLHNPEQETHNWIIDRLGNTLSSFGNIALAYDGFDQRILKMFAYGDVTNPVQFNNLYMFLNSPAGNNTSINMYTAGYIIPTRPEKTSQLGIEKSFLTNILFGLSNTPEITQSINFFANGVNPPANIYFGYDPIFPMFLQGSQTISNSIDMYLKSSLHFSLNMFLCGESLSYKNQNILMSTFGNSTSSIFSTINIFYKSTGTNSILNMFASGPNIDTKIQNLLMYIYGDNKRASSSIEMMLKNNVLGIQNDLNMYVIASGENWGFIPYGQEILMFLARNITNKLDFYVNCGTPHTSEINMALLGKNVQSGSIDLSCANIVGKKTENIKMYTHGF